MSTIKDGVVRDVAPHEIEGVPAYRVLRGFEFDVDSQRLAWTVGVRLQPRKCMCFMCPNQPGVNQNAVEGTSSADGGVLPVCIECFSHGRPDRERAEPLEEMTELTKQSEALPARDGTGRYILNKQVASIQRELGDLSGTRFATLAGP